MLDQTFAFASSAAAIFLGGVVAGSLMQAKLTQSTLRTAAKLPRHAGLQRTVGSEDAPKSALKVEHYPAPAKHPLVFHLGKTPEGRSVDASLAKFPHMIVAGLSGGGKSNHVNHMITQFMAQSPADVQLVLIDMKEGIEFMPYAGIPHLARPIADNAETAMKNLAWLEQERQRRSHVIKHAGFRNLDEYRAKHSGIPYLVAFIDEIADLIEEDPDSAKRLARLVRLARSAGIHLVIATQYPLDKYVPSGITVNCGGRIAFRLNNSRQSNVILGSAGAEDISKKGEALFTHEGIVVRLQTPLVKDSDVRSAIAAAKKRHGPELKVVKA